MALKDLFEAEFGLFNYPLCGNYDSDYDPDNGIGEYDEEEDLDMMFPDEDDKAELHEDDW